MSAPSLDATLLRLVRPQYAGDDGGALTYPAIEPSSEEKEDAAKLGLPVRVSVWDLSIASRDQATAIAKKPAYLHRWLLNEHVVGVGSSFNVPSMRVVYDPEGLDENDRGSPGAGGHSGIEGLKRGDKSNENRLEWRERLNALAALLRPFDD